MATPRDSTARMESLKRKLVYSQMHNNAGPTTYIDVVQDPGNASWFNANHRNSTGVPKRVEFAPTRPPPPPPPPRSTSVPKSRLSTPAHRFLKFKDARAKQQRQKSLTREITGTKVAAEDDPKVTGVEDPLTVESKTDKIEAMDDEKSMSADNEPDSFTTKHRIDNLISAMEDFVRIYENRSSSETSESKRNSECGDKPVNIIDSNLSSLENLDRVLSHHEKFIENWSTLQETN